MTFYSVFSIVVLFKRVYLLLYIAELNKLTSSATDNNIKLFKYLSPNKQ